MFLQQTESELASLAEAEDVQRRAEAIRAQAKLIEQACLREEADARFAEMSLRHPRLTPAQIASLLD